ncbi:MAG: hypothetical protein WAM77_10380 [Xanthobacteraceae bacterium]|jgi:hypothetical protein
MRFWDRAGALPSFEACLLRKMAHGAARIPHKPGARGLDLVELLLQVSSGKGELCCVQPIEREVVA